jgi:hypothetical protein
MSGIILENDARYSAVWELVLEGQIPHLLAIIRLKTQINWDLWSVSGVYTILHL